MATRVKWTVQEQEYLKHLKDTEKLGSWKQIANKMREQFQETVRSGKQCRERYINYARFDEKQIKVSPWSLEDDEKFTKLYFKFGAKWAHIGKQMPEKSQNCLKNRFYGGLRRLIRKINKVQKHLKARKTKPLRYETLIRVLEYQSESKGTSVNANGKNGDFKNFLDQLKADLLQQTWNVMNQIDCSFETFILVEKIHEFNARIRGLTFKRSNSLEQVRKILSSQEDNCAPMISNSAIESDTACRKEQNAANSQQSFIQQISSVEQKQIQDQQQNKILTEFPEMADFAPKVEWVNNSDDFDLEVSGILQEQFKTKAFSFFY